MFWTDFAIDALLAFYVVNCVLMCLVVLMQRSKQEGLGAAFGGGFTESVWGAQTSQVLVKATVWLAALFFILSISLARLYEHRSSITSKPSAVQQQLLAPVKTPTTSAGVPVVPTATPMTTTPAASATATNAAPAAAEPVKPAAK
jgi:preprotein translocase subunit SecG